ncbi:MAG: TonB-dependent receptor [Tannerella sp.]|jgi:TonB-linked SusC/RagA family outer membrane protein|nr:TonB-dependent receptor [Tannerella sp.]
MKVYILLLLSFACFTLSAQQRQTFVMEGVIYDETGATVPGATVYLKDKIGIGTSTDINGKFTIKASRNDIIVASFVGYEKVEYLVTEEKKDLEIRIAETTAQIDEVLIVAYGTQRKISSVAAVTTVDVKDLQVPASSIANLLGGKVAGVITMQTSGEPGKNISEFWVRGIGTFGASSGALVLIDGLEGDINTIDPADVESFSILKDASATAVYGVRGANGVVLITTKRGTEDKLSITARANWSLSHLHRMPEYLRAYDYATLVNEAMSVRGDVPVYNFVDMEMIKYGLDSDLFPDVSWQDEILNPNSFKQTYYVSARGGGQISRYFLSLGLSDETAAYRQDKNSIYSSNVGYNTYNYRANIDMNLSNSTVLYFGTDGYLSIRNEPGIANTDYIWFAQSQLNPLAFPKVYSNGMFPAAGANDLASPYVLINNTGKSSTQDYKGKVTAVIDQNLSMLLDGLKIKIQGAYDVQNNFFERRYIQPALYEALGRRFDGNLIMRESVAPQATTYSKSMNQYRKYHLESTLNYNNVFRQNHRVSGLLYYYISDHKYTREATNSLAAIPVRYQGVSSRLTYSFNDTYMIDFNFGYTGSENFQPGRQYGFFPSIALGWVPSSYQFVKDRLPWVNFFKIRGSYGTVGNDRLTSRRFPYLTMVNLDRSTIWDGSSVEVINENWVGADNLVWEKAIKTDLGVEGRFLKDRISFVVDIFSDQRDGIFQSRTQVPYYVGLINMPYGNVGRMESYGADGNTSYTQELIKDMSFAVRGNFTFSHNKVQNWEQAYMEYPYLEYSGLPNNAIRGYQAIGLFKDEDDVKYSPSQAALGSGQMPGDIKYKDVNGDGKVDATDMVPLSNNTYPTLMYGFGGEFRYRQFTVGILFKGTGRTDFYHVGQNGNGMGYVPFFDGRSGNVLTIVADPASRWIPMDYALANGIDPALAENPNARFPRLQYGKNPNNSQLSDFWKGDARYLRLQEVTINYNWKTEMLRKIGVSSIDLQLVGNNLYVWDKVKLFDPEQAVRNGRVYPIPAVYTFQLYINL